MHFIVTKFKVSELIRSSKEHYQPFRTNGWHLFLYLMTKDYHTHLSNSNFNVKEIKWSTVVTFYVHNVLSKFKLEFFYGIMAIYLPNSANWGHCEETRANSSHQQSTNRTMQDATITLCLSDASHPIKWFSVHTVYVRIKQCRLLRRGVLLSKHSDLWFNLADDKITREEGTFSRDQNTLATA